MDKEQKVIELMPGCKIYSDGSGQFQIMLGCPSEIVKVAKLRGWEELPNIIVLPTRFFQYGIVQAALEFPVYDFLFQRQGLAKGQKLCIVGQPWELESIKKVLRMTLLGPTDEQFEAWRVPQKMRHLLRQIQSALAIKVPSGSVMPIEDMVEFRSFNTGDSIGINGYQIQCTDPNVFCVTDKQREEHFIDINLSGPQRPPMRINETESVAKRCLFGATSLSICTSGFDPAGYTSGLVLRLNGLAVTVDGVAWMKDHLRSRGINPSEIKGHIVTHVHDDHSNILDLIVNGHRATIITTRLVFRCLLEKFSALMDITVKELRRLVNFVEARFDRPLQWRGATFEFFPTVHPIPTFGFRVTVNGKSIVYSGDTVWGEKLQNMVDLGFVDEAIAAKIQAIPEMSAEVLFMDGGGGMIHPQPQELSRLPEKIRQGMVLSHVSDLPGDLENPLDFVGEAGRNWEIIPNRTWSTEDMMAIMHSPILQSVGPEWVSVVMSQGHIENYEAGKDVVTEGDPARGFFLILGGTVRVWHNSETMAHLSTGDFFGEISVMNETHCTATVQTRTPVKVLRLPPAIFAEMVEATGLADKLAKIHQLRPILINFSVLRSLAPDSLNQMVESIGTRKYRAGENIVRQGEKADCLYGIIKGRAKVVVGNGQGKREIAVMYPYQIFGEIGLLRTGVRTADVIALTDMEVFVIGRNQIKKLVRQIPGLSYQLGILADDRMRK